MTLTTIRLFSTAFQKYGWFDRVAEVSERRVRSGNQVGVRLLMSPSGLNAVATIQ